MTSVLLSLALSAPAQPGFPPFPPAGPGFSTAAPPLTLQQFAQVFHCPPPGRYEVWVIHPKTGFPVKVCFALPDVGRPPKVNVGRRSVEFDYGKIEVEIEFKHNGRVEVDYDD